MAKCINWLKVGSYDGQWADTVAEDRAPSEPPEPPPLSPSLKIMWAVVLLTWTGLGIGLAAYRAWKGH